MSGVISNIQRFTVHDGPGIRLTIFLQGCPLQCWWCHNPECIPHSDSMEPKDKNTMSVKELMAEIRKEQIFMDESGGGVTFSGGEPLLQSAFLTKMLDACKEEGIHTALDTSGLAPLIIFNSIIDKPDLFLYDLKIINDNLHKKYTAASNTLILKNLESLNERQKNVIVRIPLIPGITDTKENISEMIAFLDHLPNLRKVNLLPYHSIAESKYSRLNLSYKLKGVKTADQETNQKIKKQFTDAGFYVRIGG